MSRVDPSHPSGTLGCDVAVGPSPLEGMVLDVLGSPVSAELES